MHNKSGNSIAFTNNKVGFMGRVQKPAETSLSWDLTAIPMRLRQYTLCCTLLLATSAFLNAQVKRTSFEISDGKKSATYQELIQFYEDLDAAYPSVKIKEIGPTDVREPLRVVYYSKDNHFDIDKWKRQNKVILLINNGIHPGEPDGIDASMLFLRDVASGKIDLPDHVVLAVIPVFNVGGMLNRGSYSRANQNGPEAYGFRGNAQNLDLNRDFIKMDARETRSLVTFFRELDPDVFIDNHVSNGADYQHVMTLLSPNPKKMGYYTGRYLKNRFEPGLYKMMAEKGIDLLPYVNHWGATPEKGWQQFYEPPRFASGYAALFQTFAFVPETHMLKPYPQRVRATYDLLQCISFFAAANREEIKGVRAMEQAWLQEQKELTIDWKVDSSFHSEIPYKGYEARYKPSEVSGLPRLYYDKEKPFTATIPFYDRYQSAQRASVPRFYVLQQGWHKVLSRLRWNQVELIELNKDSLMEVTAYRIEDMETVKTPFEGHYLHSKIKCKAGKEWVQLRKGDILIPTDQRAKRYLVETLEPNAPDAFMAWNFFDAILQQKEHFSDYVFEDEASRLLKTNPDLKAQLDSKRQSDPKFAADAHAQLEFVYRHSKHLEPEFMRYPVFKID
jgi:hypothetical protein